MAIRNFEDGTSVVCEYVAPTTASSFDARAAKTKLKELMGDSYVELSFLYARNTVESLGADIKLYYNDYNAYFSDKAKAIAHCKELIALRDSESMVQYLVEEYAVKFVIVAVELK